MDVIDKIKQVASNAAVAHNVGNSETEGLGNELREKAKMVNEVKGTPTPEAPAPKPAAPSPKDKINPKAKYGDRGQEKRLDVSDALKPLGSFKQGTDYVPKTGMYVVHEGEAIDSKPTGGYTVHDTDKITQKPPVLDSVTVKPTGPKPPMRPVTEYPKPTPKAFVGSFKNGTPYVPATGPALLHEGEKVTPKEQNPNAGGGANVEHSPAEKAHFHRAMAKLHAGGLHDHFGMKHDAPIPMEKKEEAARSSNKHVAAMGRMALAMHGWKH